MILGCRLANNPGASEAASFKLYSLKDRDAHGPGAAAICGYNGRLLHRLVPQLKRYSIQALYRRAIPTMNLDPDVQLKSELFK